VNDIAIIGTGRLGTSLAAALAAAQRPVRYLADRNTAAARASRKIVGRGLITTDSAVAAAGADIVFLTVPDDEIASAAKRLAREGGSWRGKIVFHTSGLRPSEDLKPLRALGAACASFHPVQSFPKKDTPASHFSGIFIGLEGDAKAVRAGRALARGLGSRPFHVEAKDKPLYHAACSMASNLFVPLFEAARGLLRATGLGDREAARILVPLIERTLQHVKDLDAATSLTGPISRGDADTVKAHLAALKDYPSARKIYTVLSREALRIAERNNIPAAKVNALKRRLAGK
jgi:predicted short-subunit dehydrogenase-like oxidoreductase (DUF2520 family)